MIDTHAHLLYFDDREELIKNMGENGLEAVVTIGTTIEDSLDSVKLAEKYENVYATVGIYPEYANLTTEEDLKKLEEMAKNEKVVAIGEIGLDYHTDVYDAEAQKKLLVKQLEIADRLGLPFCIHCRKAGADLYEVLSANKHLINHAGLMHCYSEGKEWVHKFLDLGMYISFSGNITYKKTDRSYLKEIPIDRIVVETDAPYLTPEPFRGRENRPELVKHTLQRIADELEMSFEELEKQTTKNAKRFYFKMKNK